MNFYTIEAAGAVPVMGICCIFMQKTPIIGAAGNKLQKFITHGNNYIILTVMYSFYTIEHR
jgi:hypothetical protein